MGLFDKLIKDGIKNAVGNAVEEGLKKAIAPKIEEAAANSVNKAADAVNNSFGQNTQETPQSSTVNQESVDKAASTLGGLFGSMQGAAMGFANEAAKNMKICLSCGEGASAETKFCPGCGAELPEQTVAQGAVCISCGKQNDIGTKFCADCGEKLPSALAEEAAIQKKNEDVLSSWDSLLPVYPKWSFGGTKIEIEDMGSDENGRTYYSLCVENTNRSALDSYRNLLKQNGFREAGEYPSISQLYKKIDDVCYCFDSEEPFPSDSGRLYVYFLTREPSGGFDYVKPEPKQKSSGLFDLFK